MKQFRIDPRANGGEMFVLEAADYSDAADAAAKKLFPHSKIQIHRHTGESGKTGMFQAFRVIDANLSSSHGDPFHVMEL